jgi:hypothetical protein
VRMNDVIAIVTSADGVRDVDLASSVNDVVAAERLRWIDIVTRTALRKHGCSMSCSGLIPPSKPGCSVSDRPAGCLSASTRSGQLRGW